MNEDDSRNAVWELRDEHQGRTVYSRAHALRALLGAGAGAALVGVPAFLVSSGIVPIEGLGQVAAAGPGPASVAGASIGAAAGALLALSVRRRDSATR